MNVPDHYRTALDELTRDRPEGVDLSAVIDGGRRRRRVRRTAWGGAALVVAAAAGSAGMVLTHDGRHTAVDVDSGPAAPGAAYRDFVAGTDLDETMQAAVARHLPAVPAADDVYPSDWNTPGPIPDSEFTDATEWHAIYQVSGRERLTVIASQPIPHQPVTVNCDDLEQGDIPCRRVELPDGSVETRSGYLLGTSTFRFMTVHVTADGFITETLDDVQAGSVAEADGVRQLTDAETASLVGDPALRFPDPVVAPPPPTQG